MKSPILLAFLLGMSVQTFSQKLYPIKTADDSISFHLTVQNGALTLALLPGEGNFKNKNDFPALHALRLESGDLVLEYQPRKSTDLLSYKVEMVLQMPDGQLLNPFAFDLSNDEGTEGIHRLVWMDAAEHLPDYNATYVLRIRRSLMGAVKCDGPRPVFSLKKRLPHYAVGGVGVVLIGLGQVYRNQRDGYYSDYQRRWSDGFPAPGNNSNPLEMAREKDRDARICMWTGIGILGVDALLFTWRGIKIKKKQKTYDKFCGDSSSFNIRPQILPVGVGIAFSSTW